jgi:hypothetical protein
MVASTLGGYDDPYVIELVGDIGASGMKQIKSTLNAALKRTTGAVVVSFEKTKSFETGLLKELMRIGAALSSAQRELVIVIPRSHPGRHIFHVLNLDKKFECFETRAQAAIGNPRIGQFFASDMDRVHSWARSEPARR